MAKKAKKTKKAEDIGRDIGRKIDNEIKEHKGKCGCGCKKNKNPLSCVYGMGFVGALVYYISTATGFWNGVWGVIKALLWPTFLTYELFKYLGM